MALKILLIDSDSGRAQSLERSLTAAGFADVSRLSAGSDLVRAVENVGPDLVIIDMALPDRDALDGIREVSARIPGPVVMFADEEDATFVEEAIAAGVCSYNLSGAASHDVKPIVRSAIAMFQRYRRAEAELQVTRSLLEERRVIERAKAILMRHRKMTEPGAYAWLRRRAMNENRKIAQVATDLVKKEEDVGRT